MALIEIALQVGALIAALVWLTVVLAAPRRPLEASGSPARRLAGVRMWLYAPLLVPVLLVLATLARNAVELFIVQADHCFSHVGHHHHLCVVHPPHSAEALLSRALPALILIPALLLLTRCGWRLWQEARLARSLVRSSRPSTLGPDVRVLDQQAPLALTVGGLKPVILVSTGLMEGLSPAALEAVLAHERAHVARRDILFSLMDRLAAALLPARIRRPLMADLTLAREQACDAHAAERVGGPLAVAAALTEVARLRLAAPAVGLSVAAGSLEARVAMLLKPAPRRQGEGLLPWAWMALVVAVGAGPLHGPVEHLLDLLLH